MSKGKTALKFFGMFDKVDIMAQLSDKNLRFL